MQYKLVLCLDLIIFFQYVNISPSRIMRLSEGVKKCIIVFLAPNLAFGT